MEQLISSRFWHFKKCPKVSLALGSAIQILTFLGFSDGTKWRLFPPKRKFRLKVLYLQFYACFYNLFTFAFSAFSGRRRSERGRSDSLATSSVNKKVPSSLRSLNHLSSYILLIRRKKLIRQKKFPSQTKKVRLGFRGFRTCFWEVDHPLCHV